tara:strand:+ start:197 stop:547 length:351 start_codon:yes stop_codon:yes gene_type:complete
MKLKTYTEFLNEAQLSSIKAGEDSKVEVSDQKTVDGEVIPAQEILGQILNAETEDEFKAYFYDKYGSTKFDVETMGQMLTDYQDYYKEQAEEEKEKEKEEEGGNDAEGGDDLDLDI